MELSDFMPLPTEPIGEYLFRPRPTIGLILSSSLPFAANEVTRRTYRTVARAG